MIEQKQRQKQKPAELHNDGHDFDGIQEFNNPFPRWWVWLFVITAAIAPAYMIWLHTPLGDAHQIAQEYESELNAVKQGAAQVQTVADPAAILKDAQAASAGKSVFEQNCAACHAADGGGIVGPNLVDNFWIHGSTVQEVEAVISNGVSAKGMPGWKNILGPEKIRQAISYIAQLQGKAPAKPKGAEGQSGVLH